MFNNFKNFKVENKRRFIKTSKYDGYAMIVIAVTFALTNYFMNPLDICFSIDCFADIFIYSQMMIMWILLMISFYYFKFVIYFLGSTYSKFITPHILLVICMLIFAMVGYINTWVSLLFNLILFALYIRIGISMITSRKEISEKFESIESENSDAKNLS